MNILHLDSSILGAHSVSRALSADIVAKLKAATPEATVAYRDLAADPIAHLSGAYLAAAAKPDDAHGAALQADLATGAETLKELFAADVLVIGLGFYNFTIPSQLKAWLDRILVAGKTFRYDANGQVEGLAGGKRAILAIARGAVYAEGSPYASFEHAETYLRSTLGFIGIRDIEVIAADGIAYGPDQRAAAIATAQDKIAALAA